MDDLAALRLMIDWGADEALSDSPVDRFVAPAVAVPTAPPLQQRIPAAISAPSATAPAQAATDAAANAPDLAALHAAMDAFIACPLRGTASTTVAPTGNAAAGLLLIYETPGPDDDRSGQALSGAAGVRIDRVLASVGLDRSKFMAAPMVPWRPPGGRPVNDTELALCLPFLRRLLVLARPRHVVLLGAGPYRVLAASYSGAQDGSFRKARGKWTDISIDELDVPVPALTMLQPDLWLSNAANRQATWTDLLILTERLGQS
jgi:DNA polymerase